MSPDELEFVLRRLRGLRPFRAFLIEFHSGDRLSVRHPEAVIRWGDLYVFFGRDFERRFFSPSSVCQVLLPPPPPEQAGPTAG